MNKTAIKNFAVWARNKLIDDIKYRAGLMGITENGITSALPQSTGTTEFYDIGTAEPYAISGDEIKQRHRLVEIINQKAGDSDYNTAYQYIIEEVAYTWFNRLIAIRFMEVNDYLPSHIRVLSSESGKLEPDLVTTPFDADLDFTSEEEQTIVMLKQDNNLDELFRMLFIKQCNALNEVLPELFEKTKDYTELLLNISVIDKEGVVYHLINDIFEEDFDIQRSGQIEIIGWLYQYYISEKHEEVVNVLSKKMVTKEDIPAATQLFTTDWVVRYLVDNSLGRYWIERNPQSNLRKKLKYFVSPKSGEIKYINEKIEITDLTFFDPCMGSGHILVYAFDVLMEIYREVGYTDRDAAISILKNNIFGLDIDQRAYQLTYFSLMMKARSYNRRILTTEVVPNVCAIVESNGIDNFVCEGITTDKKQNYIGEYLIEVFRNAKEIGSLQNVKFDNYQEFKDYLNACDLRGKFDLFSMNWRIKIAPLMRKLCDQAIIMSNKYSVVCTNPPYLNKMDGYIKDFVVTNYKTYGGDLFSTFMYRNFDYCCEDGYSAFMTPNVWMFIKSYEHLRDFIIKNKTVTTLVQMAKGAFYREATVDVCAFVFQNKTLGADGVYVRLEQFKGDMELQNKAFLQEVQKDISEHIYECSVSEFDGIEGKPFAYWISDVTKKAFLLPTTIGRIAPPKQGMATADNERFLRLWYEVSIDRIGFGISSIDEAKKSEKKWFPYNKGGSYRRWYGNRDYVVNWENDGFEIKNFKDPSGKLRSRPQNLQYFFKPAITWSDTTSASFSGRYSERGFIFDIKGSSGFPNAENLLYVLGLLNSGVSQAFIKILNPTITTQVGDMARIPVALETKERGRVEAMVQENVLIAKQDWDSFETSWDFSKHPLVRTKTVEEAYLIWERECESRFLTLKNNEEELNRIFIDIYGLDRELTSAVEDKDVTIRTANRERDVRSLLSYAVGCIFGRYSLDVKGLAYVSGEWEANKYRTFIPDADNIVPITDEEYFEDDLVSLFCTWLKVVYGTDTLEENLHFIAKSLGCKGNSSRDVIRNYFLNHFFKEHCNTYSITGSGKRPVYWLFDSGKQNGFKALIYMHRYNADIIGSIRVDYLHRIQRVYESEIKRMQDAIDHSTNTREVVTASKRKEKLQKQLKECREYDEKIGHLALSRIELDLDDGVKVNYEKVQTASDDKKYQVLAKI